MIRRAPLAVVLVALALALAACGGPITRISTTPAGAPASPPTATTSPPALPELARHDPPLVVTPGPPNTALAARFAPLPLPGDVPALMDVDGRGERDVWFIATNGAVLRWDGSGFTREGAPACVTDSCCGTLVPPNRRPRAQRAGEPPRTQEIGFDRLRLTPSEVIVRTVVDTGGMRGSLVEARRERPGRWICEQGTDDLVYPGAAGRGDGAHALEILAAGALVRLEPPAMLANALGGYALTIDGRRVPLPEGTECSGMCARDVGLSARSADELWLYRSSGSLLWRGNGLTWNLVKVPADDLSDVWVGEPGELWAAAFADGREILLRRESTGAWRRFEIPGASQMLRSDRGRFWLVATRRELPAAPSPLAIMGLAPKGGPVAAPRAVIYRWDGASLAAGAAPIEIERVWRSPADELWIVGRDPTRRVKAAGGDAPAGAAYRVIVKETSRP